MNLSLRARYKKISTGIVIFIILALLIQNSFNTWLAYSYAQGPQPSGLMLASDVEPENPDYYFLLAYYLMEYDHLSSYESAMEQYEKAILLSPFNYNYWYFLAELLYNGGQKERAIFALNQATGLSPGVASLRWRAGMLASKMGDRESILDNLGAVIKNDHKRRLKAFSLLWQSVGYEELIFDSISDNALPSYFNYLRVTNRIDEATRVFDKLTEINYDTTHMVPKYTSDLIRTGDVETAKLTWANAFGSWDGVWNGQFDNEIKNEGFDWRIGRIEGAKIKRDMDSYSGKYSVKISFDGTENVDFRHFYQFIPVQGRDDYTISLRIKSEALLTSEKLQWRTSCLNNDELSARSEPIQATHDWKIYNISFSAPDDCEVLLLRLEREKSNKTNSLISGTLWVDDVSLAKR